MKFIFPQNYNFDNKLFGFIDYTTLILNVLWGLFVYFFINLFLNNITIKISLFITFFLPVFLFSIIGFNHEKITYIIKYLYYFIKKPKVYLYRKYFLKNY